ncbi:hypothetical protein [Alkalicoccus chagannorensis]|uniref:hypothetical protein n=1 Tax=Alkalicoccus chagannorensis TaxID=427072 RepID=UPI0003FC53E3|nr:hypothetical protein [Alkalicoccus chagannorensis]
MWLYDLFLVLFGVGLGVFAADPIKNLFTGRWKEQKKQQHRVALLSYLREQEGKTFSREELNEKVFRGKKAEAEVEKLLQETAESTLIYAVEKRGERLWTFDRSAYDKNKHKFQ